MKKRKIKIDKNFVLNEAYEKYKYLCDDMIGGQEGNYNVPGISDYPFYAYLSSLFKKTTILEIGTCVGGSAIMMSHNTSNKIITYDIVDHVRGGIQKENVEFRLGNFMDDEIDYKSIDFISIDAGHDGNSEIQMVKYLEDNWKGGLLFLDDIHNNSDGDMRGFWESIDRERHEVYDVSDIAHGLTLGSGLVNFNRYYDLTIE
jgi:hypothetical protein